MGGQFHGILGDTVRLPRPSDTKLWNLDKRTLAEVRRQYALAKRAA